MLSNTATPIYYGRFRDAVIRGEIPVCETISLQMNRIDALIEDPGIWYDDQAVQGFIDFCEEELTLTNGEDVKLLPSFKLWAEDIFGWYYFEEMTVPEPSPDGRGTRYVRKRIKKRLINKQYLIIARGNAKSMYASFLHNYFLNIDTSTTLQVATAPTMRQADEVISPIRTAIRRARGPLFQFLTDGNIRAAAGTGYNKAMLDATKKGVENFFTGSLLEVRPMTIDKLQGLRVKLATVDEWLSGDIRENVIETLEQSARKEQGSAENNDWLIVAISSEGTVRNGPGDDIKMELMNILKGDYNDIHTSIWWYKLDDISEVGNPDMWMKASPNIGITVSYSTYQDAVEKAEKVPSQKNDILAKRFGIPSEGYTYFFTYDETLVFDKRLSFWKMPCALGADLSQGDDFCSFSFLFPLRDGKFGIKTRNYITELTLKKLPMSMRSKYDEFMKEGSLMIMQGTVLDMMEVYEELEQFIEDHNYEVCAFGYDPYGAEEFINRWERENGSYSVVKVPQGARTESIPLGELKKLAEERMLLFDEKIMSFAMGNCIALEDTNGNRKLYKKRREQKIDPVAAMMDAYIAYKLNKDAFE